MNETLNTYDDCNLAHDELNIDILKIHSGVPAHRFTVEYLFPVPQNFQDLDVEKLELFLEECLN